MRLIVIYGPPAAGKLTVSKELSKITGYKVFHNHLALDLLESVLERSHARFWELLDKHRLEMIEAAAAEKVHGVIMTSVHINGKDDKFIKDIINAVEKHSGSVHFVHLSCDRKKLESRLVEASRKEFGKLTDVSIFNNFVDSNDVFSRISFVQSYEIDNTKIDPEETAKMIKEHYSL
jgi:broad-specificity NMP kinase